jgi:predicted RNA-binding Zn ribbon-like protein
MTNWNPAPGEAASVALSLVNSRYPRQGEVVDHLPTTAAVEHWLASRALRRPAPATVSGAELGRLIGLRTALHELLTARIDGRPPDPHAVTQVNEASAQSPAAAQLDWPPRRHWLAAPAVSFDTVLADIADDAIGLLTTSDGENLRICGAHGCTRLFLREHARRQWCSTMCGDRVRAARQYERTKGRER